MLLEACKSKQVYWDEESLLIWRLLLSAYTGCYLKCFGERRPYNARPTTKRMLYRARGTSKELLCVQVEQQYLITSMASQHATLLAVIREHIRTERDFKVMCFFTTARITQFYCALFNALGVPVLEMHSRKSQAQRTRAADQFRASKRCIMFSSDVSARGVDYPDVSLVIQVRSC